MANILVNNNFYISTSDACVIDLTPPTFAGINFSDVESRGQIRVGWSAGSDANNPIRYEVYIQANTATSLFNVANIIAITPNLQFDIFTLPNGGFLENGVTYFLGVRAVDTLGNRDTNLVSLSKISTGVLTSIDTFLVQANYSINENDQFNLSGFANKNDSLAIPASDSMGAASYQVFDSLGSAVVGMSGALANPNASGLYIFDPVSNLLDLLNRHYQVQLSILVDGEVRTNYIPLKSYEKSYELNFVSDFNTAGQLVGSFWVTKNSQLVTSSLGLGSFEIYSSSGSLLPLAETGITANAEGFYVITPLTPATPIDPSQGLVVRASVVLDGKTHSQQIVIANEPEVYEANAVFSINALNQLQATLWSTKNDNLVVGASLGTASYQVYDRAGVIVAGVAESGIVADVNGNYISTPVSAALLSDLTHYTAQVIIRVAGVDRTSIKGFTLLGT